MKVPFVLLSTPLPVILPHENDPFAMSPDGLVTTCAIVGVVIMVAATKAIACMFMMLLSSRKSTLQFYLTEDVIVQG